MNTFSFRLPLLAIAMLAMTLTACSAAVRNSMAENSDTECRGVQRQGSNLRESICLPKEEWAAIDEETAKQAEGVGDFIQRSDEINAQIPVTPGQTYDPYGRGGY